MKIKKKEIKHWNRMFSSIFFISFILFVFLETLLCCRFCNIVLLLLFFLIVQNAISVCAVNSTKYIKCMWVKWWRKKKKKSSNVEKGRRFYHFTFVFHLMKKQEAKEQKKHIILLIKYIFILLIPRGTHVIFFSAEKTIFYCKH